VEKTCAAIKKVLIELYADANKIYVVYGGSVNEKNSKEILALDSVDGCLVGGAALDPDKFFEIYSSAPDMIK
jgi:triosephosphate isomerase